MPEIQLLNKHERNISFGSTLFAFEPEYPYINTAVIDVEEKSAELPRDPLDLALSDTLNLTIVPETIREPPPASPYFTKKSALSTISTPTYPVNSEKGKRTTTIRDKIK